MHVQQYHGLVLVKCDEDRIINFECITTIKQQYDKIENITTIKQQYDKTPPTHKKPTAILAEHLHITQWV